MLWKKNRDIKLGYGEAKIPGENLDKIEKSDQMDRYRGYVNLFFDEQALAEQTKLLIEKHADEVYRPDRYVGIWRNPDDDVYYVDINERLNDKNDALERVKTINARSNRRIIAIYNPELDQSIEI